MRTYLNLMSEVAFSADGAPRPIHILRTGTFTGSNGAPYTFERSHLQRIVANFQAGRRKNPPITEQHDFGRAIGRITKVWADESGTHLFALPKWSAAGRQLLADEVYDGFSVELEAMDRDPVLIGGSLTNYPAVDGLRPVTLAAPQVRKRGAPQPVQEQAPEPPSPTLQAAYAAALAGFRMEYTRLAFAQDQAIRERSLVALREQWAGAAARVAALETTISRDLPPAPMPPVTEHDPSEKVARPLSLRELAEEEARRTGEPLFDVMQRLYRQLNQEGRIVRE